MQNFVDISFKVITKVLNTYLSYLYHYVKKDHYWAQQEGLLVTILALHALESQIPFDLF